MEYIQVYNKPIITFVLGHLLSPFSWPCLSYIINLLKFPETRLQHSTSHSWCRQCTSKRRGLPARCQSDPAFRPEWSLWVFRGRSADIRCLLSKFDLSDTKRRLRLLFESYSDKSQYCTVHILYLMVLCLYHQHHIIHRQNCVPIYWNNFRLRNDLYCVEWGVKLYSLTETIVRTHLLRINKAPKRL